MCGNTTISYFYDENNQLYGYKKNSTVNFYIRDVLGNIIGILNNSGVIVSKFDYDAFGNIINQTGSVISNFRYKGYYYDTDIELYYLKSRFYSSELCRFISPDSVNYLDPSSINGLNLYCYCHNNPVMYSDESGHIAISTLVWILIGAAVLTTAGVVTYGAVSEKPVVLDASFSAGIGAGIGVKVGISFVLDFKNGSIGFYPHAGVFAGVKFNAIGGSYSVGVISNYENEGDYAGPFTDMGGGYLVGIDHCFDPTKYYDVSTRASSITFGNNKGVYYGNDYYWYLGSIRFPWRN